VSPCRKQLQQRNKPTEFFSSRAILHACLCSILFLTGCYTNTLMAADFKAFQFIDYDAWFEYRHTLDEYVDSNNGAETYRQKQRTNEEELFIMTRSFILHPNFINMDIGGGVNLVQDMFQNSNVSTEYSDELFNFDFRANILQKKPHPLTFYYKLTHPSELAGVSERLQQTSSITGFEASLLQPLVPFRLNISASQQDLKGSNTSRIVDDESDRYEIKLSKIFTQDYSTRFSYSEEYRTNRSGNLSSEIVDSINDIRTFTYGSEWQFGNNKQFRYFDFASSIKQEGPVNRDEVRFTPNLHWKISNKLNSTFGYNYIESMQNQLSMTHHFFNTRLNYNHSDSTHMNAGIRYQEDRMDGSLMNTNSIDGAIRFKRILPIGTLSLRMATKLDINDRDTQTNEVDIIGEQVTLTGLTPVALSRDFIVDSSIVVMNLARTQTYIPMLDYRVIVIGSQTEIQRLSGSNIGDPETVLVDYSYEVGEDVSYQALTQDYQALLKVNQHVEFLVRFHTLDHTVESGDPSLLNDKESFIYGVKLEYPVTKIMEIGAGAEHESHDEDISPFERDNANAWFQLALPAASRLRLALNLSKVDYENSIEDVDLEGISMLFRSRPFSHTLITLEARSEKETGGSVPREIESIRLNAQWQLYQVTLSAEANYSFEKTGDIERDRSGILFTLRRD